MVEMDQNQIK